MNSEKQFHPTSKINGVDRTDDQRLHLKQYFV